VPSAAGTPFAGVVTALCERVRAAADDVVLVIDDYHLVEAPEVHRSMEFLLDHLPPALHVVLASRSDPPLPLARLRARGQLVELRAGDLRFTSEEAAQLLRTEVGAHLTDPWSRRSAIAPRAGPRACTWRRCRCGAAATSPGFVAEFSGSHRFVLDYLTEEVLERQPAELRTFLLETSVLDRLCGPLCDAVVRRPGRPAAAGVGRAGEPVPDPARRGAPVVALPPPLRRPAPRQPARPAPGAGARAAPRGGGVVRRARPARRRHPARAGRGRHRPCGRARRGAPGGAGVAARPGRHHRRVARRAAVRGDPPQATADPRPGGGVAHGRAGSTRSSRSSPWPSGPLERTPAEPYRASLDRRFSVLANIPAGIAVCRATWRACAATSTPSRRSPAPRSPTSPSRTSCSARFARYQVAFGDWLAGRVVAAERGLAGVFAERVASAQHDLVPRAAFDLGAAQLAGGHLRAALRTYEHGLRVTEGDRPSPSAGMLHVGLAEVHFERDELAEANRRVAAGIEQCRRLAYLPALIAGLIILARLRHAEGDPAGALAAVDEADRAMPQAVIDPRLPVSALRAHLAVARGDLAEAAQWVRTTGLSVDDEPSYLREPEHRVLVRILIAQRDPATALAVVERWRALAVAQERTASVLRLWMLEVLAHHAAGDRTAALRALAEALALGAPEGYVRVFLDEGAPVGALLRELAGGRRLEQLGVRAVPRAFLAALIAAFDRHGGRPPQRGSGPCRGWPPRCPPVSSKCSR
jgi:LuxR family maltose regulon positive regulatory protein